MGQKINPIGLRLTINKTWGSKWFAEKKDYAKLLHNDIKIRKFLEKKLASAGLSKVVIERSSKKAVINIHASRPGVIIGKKGEGIEVLKKEVQKVAEGDVVLNIVEVKKPELDAKITAENIARQIEKRISYKRAMKRSLQDAMRMGAKGIKVSIGGRLNGAEIARIEWSKEGRIPLHTLRSDISYGTARANTTYGVIGIKVWIYTGDKTTYVEEKAPAKGKK